MAGGGSKQHRGIQSDKGRRRILVGVAVGQAAANSSHIADAGSGDSVVGLGGQDGPLRDQGAGGNLLLGAERADTEAAIISWGYFPQAGQAAQADDVGRLGKALFHLQYQGGAAGKQAGVIAILGQQVKGGGQGSRLMELEVVHLSGSPRCRRPRRRQRLALPIRGFCSSRCSGRDCPSSSRGFRFR